MSMSPGQLIVIAVIVVVLFGTKKLRSLGSDVGASIKGFKKAMSEESPPPPPNSTEQDADFAAKITAEPTAAVKPDAAKSQNKEQV